MVFKRECPFQLYVFALFQYLVYASTNTILLYLFIQSVGNESLKDVSKVKDLIYVSLA